MNAAGLPRNIFVTCQFFFPVVFRADRPNRKEALLGVNKRLITLIKQLKREIGENQDLFIQFIIEEVPVTPGGVRAVKALSALLFTMLWHLTEWKHIFNIQSYCSL